MFWVCLNIIVERANPSTSRYTSFSHDDAGLTASRTLTSGVIHDKELSRRQREKERMGNIIDERREQRNAQRRATYRKKKEEGTINLQETTQEQRERRMQRRKSMTADEKGESSAQRKANYAKRKNTPCAESIAMPRPDLASTTTDFQASTPRTSPVFQAEAASPTVRPTASMPTYTVGTDGKTWLCSQYSAQDYRTCAYHLNDVADDMEAFLSGIMGDNPIPPDFMDDEY